MQLFDQEASSCSPSTAFRGVRTVPTLCTARCFLWDMVFVGERACCHMKMIYPSVNTSILTVIAHRTSICHRSCTLLTLAPGSMLWECDKLSDIFFMTPFFFLFFLPFCSCQCKNAVAVWPFLLCVLALYFILFFSFVFIWFLLLNNKCTINHWWLQGIKCVLVCTHAHTQTHTHTHTHTHTKQQQPSNNNKSK